MVPMIAIPGSEDVLELAPTSDGLGYIASIIRRGSDGSAAWTLLPPRNGLQDAWVAVRVDGQEVVANSWSCYEVRLDVGTGLELSRTFTK